MGGHDAAAGGGGWPAPAAGPDPAAADIDEVVGVVACTRDRAREALQRNQGDRHRAINWCLENPVPPAGMVAPLLPGGVGVGGAGQAAGAMAGDDALQRALEASRQTVAVDEMRRLQNAATGAAAAPGAVGGGADDASMQKALLESMATAKENRIDFMDVDAARNPIELQRKEGMPVGLKNVGNTCYFNTFMQLYFFFPSFRKAVYEWRAADAEGGPSAGKSGRAAPVGFMRALQRAFAGMQLSARKYVDPSAVLAPLQQEGRRPGEQEDCPEFNDRFLSLAEDALSLPRDPDDPGGPPAGDSRLLSNVFFGIRVERYAIVGLPTEPPRKREKVDPFRALLLAVEGWCRSLHDLLELHTQQEQIDGYIWDDAHPEETRPCSKQTWFQELPPVATFQLQRVLYDKEKKSLTKNRTVVSYPATLCLDRYHVSNAETTLRIRQRVSGLRAQLDEAETRLAELRDHRGHGRSLPALLRAVEAAWAEDTAPQQQRGRRHTAPTFADDLRKWAAAEEEELAKLEESVALLQKQIDSAYDGEVPERVRYRLYGVLTHDGAVAFSGHYWVCIYNEERKGWCKFNDRVVSEVSEEDVLTNGGAGEGAGANAAAYCLVYVQEGRDMSHGTAPPQDMALAVEKENEDLRMEVERWQANEQLVAEALQRRKQQLQSAEECCFEFDTLSPPVRDLRVTSRAAYAASRNLRGGGGVPEAVMSTLVAVEVYAEVFPDADLIADLQRPASDAERRDRAEKAAKDAGVLSYAVESRGALHDVGVAHRAFVTALARYRAALTMLRSLRNSATVDEPHISTLQHFTAEHEVVEQHCRWPYRVHFTTVMFILRWCRIMCNGLLQGIFRIPSLDTIFTKTLARMRGVTESMLPPASVERVRARVIDEVAKAVEDKRFASAAMMVQYVLQSELMNRKMQLREYLRAQWDSAESTESQPPSAVAAPESLSALSELADQVLALEEELFVVAPPGTPGTPGMPSAAPDPDAEWRQEAVEFARQCCCDDTPATPAARAPGPADAAPIPMAVDG